MKILRSIFFLILGILILGVFFHIVRRFSGFFSDPGWSEWSEPSSSGQSYRWRVEGGNMWFLILVFFPFAAGAFYSFSKVEILWKTAFGSVICGIVVLLVDFLGAWYLLTYIKGIFSGEDSLNFFEWIMGAAGLGCILWGVSLVAIECFKTAWRRYKYGKMRGE